MLTETLIALRRLGLLRVGLLMALFLGAEALLAYLDTTGSGVWLVLTVMVGHMVCRATALDQPLFTTDGKGNFPHMGRFVLANLWVYGLGLLAMMPGVIAAGAFLYTGSLTPTETIALFAWGAVLPLLGTLAFWGTALPAAAMGAPYGMPTALAETRGQRWQIFLALLLGPGALNALSILLALATVEGPPDILTAMMIGGMSSLLSTLGLILTAIILTLAWRRHHPVTTMAEVFE